MDSSVSVRSLVPSQDRPRTLPRRSPVKSGLKRLVRAFGDAPLVSSIVHNPRVKRVLSAMPGSGALYGSGWDRRHPFDRLYGTDTSGFIPMDELKTGDPADVHGSPYAGAQPSVVRTVLATLPGLERCAFVDLGCGKGRPLLIASEFPFRDVVGVELAPALADVARKNAGIMGRQFPDRTRIRVVTGDATAFPIPGGDVVLFLYNSFDRELMSKLVANVEAALVAERRSIYIVYCNPAVGDCFDASPALRRRLARSIPYAPDELGFGEDTEDAVIVWQGGTAPEPVERADAEIVVLKERWRAGLRQRAAA